MKTITRTLIVFLIFQLTTLSFAGGTGRFFKGKYPLVQEDVQEFFGEDTKVTAQDVNSLYFGLGPFKQAAPALDATVKVSTNPLAHSVCGSPYCQDGYPIAPHNMTEFRQYIIDSFSYLTKAGGGWPTFEFIEGVDDADVVVNFCGDHMWMAETRNAGGYATFKHLLCNPSTALICLPSNLNQSGQFRGVADVLAHEFGHATMGWIHTQHSPVIIEALINMFGNSTAGEESIMAYRNFLGKTAFDSWNFSSIADHPPGRFDQLLMKGSKRMATLNEAWLSSRHRSATLFEPLKKRLPLHMRDLTSLIDHTFIGLLRGVFSELSRELLTHYRPQMSESNVIATSRVINDVFNIGLFSYMYGLESGGMILASSLLTQLPFIIEKVASEKLKEDYKKLHKAFRLLPQVFLNRSFLMITGLLGTVYYSTRCPQQVLYASFNHIASLGGALAVKVCKWAFSKEGNREHPLGEREDLGFIRDLEMQDQVGEDGP